MKESFVLQLSSQSATNRLGANKRAYQYNINWSAILPKPADITQKYQLKYTFSSLSTASISDIYTISVDFGGSNVYEQTNSKSTFIGLAFPIGNNGTNYYIQSKYPDNVQVCIEYPNNSLITVNITPLLVGSGNIWNIEYIMMMEFTPI